MTDRSRNFQISWTRKSISHLSQIWYRQKLVQIITSKPRSLDTVTITLNDSSNVWKWPLYWSSGDSEKPHSLTSRFILYQNIIRWVVHHFINHPHEFLHALGDLDQSRKKLTTLFLVQSICMMLHYTASWLLWRGWPTSWFVLAEDANLFFLRIRTLAYLKVKLTMNLEKYIFGYRQISFQ